MGTVNETNASAQANPLFDAEVEKNLEKIEDLRRNYRPGDGSEIRCLVQEGMAEIQQNALKDLTVLESGEKHNARVAASKDYFIVEGTLRNYSQNFLDSRFNPRQLLTDYADAYYQYIRGCPLSPIPDNEHQADLIGDIKKGDPGCNGLILEEQNVRTLVAIGFADKAPTSHYIYASSSFSPNKVRRSGEFYPEETKYDSFAVNAGYQRTINSRETGPLIEGEFNYVGGGQGNLGSHIYDFSLDAGWEQHFGRPFFLRLQGGLGLALNYLNFGEGLELQKETSLMGQGETAAGAEIHIDPFIALQLSVGYFYEQTLLGAPDYYNHGPFLAGTVKFNRLFAGRSQ
ncbi:MAG: hypothetical protein HYU99_10855 [Deltaproteobacteria bacterium]|nr:hypothetical protein [Deltaproteobacteria bacterium]